PPNHLLIMTVFSNHHYRVELSADETTLEFHWEDANVNMTYADFQEACSNYLGYAFEYETRQFLIDVRNFRFQLPPEFPAWQREEHYPRYYKRGVRKVAYVMPAEYVPQAKTIEATPGKFALENFATPAEANTWLRA
ncbi:MAG: hypothetical protein AAFZ52_17970, partial [Bacteroidota bacterium]